MICVLIVPGLDDAADEDVDDDELEPDDAERPRLCLRAHRAMAASTTAPKRLPTFNDELDDEEVEDAPESSASSTSGML